MGEVVVAIVVVVKVSNREGKKKRVSEMDWRSGSRNEACREGKAVC